MAPDYSVVSAPCFVTLDQVQHLEAGDAPGRSKPIFVHVGVGPGGRSRAAEGRLPGARYLDLETDLSAPPDGTRGRHPLPTPERFAQGLSREGIGAGDWVVAYDLRGGAYAARLTWMLRTLGQQASLLVPSPTSSERTEVGPEAPKGATISPGATLLGGSRGDLPVRAWPRRALASAKDVSASLAAGGVVLDSRDGDRFIGHREPIDPVAGHIPGAISVPHRGNLGRDGNLLPLAEIADRFAVCRRDARAIVYCGSGVTACFNALAMEAAGLPVPRLYVGSWSGWIANPDNPRVSGR